jgi:hypothetical protein
MKKPHKASVSNDRLGPDKLLDVASGPEGETSDIAFGDEEVPTSDHRVSKIEPDDEHNNESLVEEGLQGYMHDSLTKPRKIT